MLRELQAQRLCLAVGQGGDLSEAQEIKIFTDQCQTEHFGCGCKKAVGGIRMRQFQQMCNQDDFVRERCLPELRGSSSYPRGRIDMQLNSTLAMQSQCFPSADRR